MNLGLAGRVVVVTGAASGIGAASAREFGAEGAEVILVDRDAKVADVAAQIPGAVALQRDLTDPGARAEVAQLAQDRGGCDVLVCSAAVVPVRTSFSAITDEDWRATFEVNVVATAAICRALVPQVRERTGAIVVITSTSGRYPEPWLADYCASKAALLSLTGSLATELGPDGVRCVAVSPGPVRTELWDRPGGFVDHLAERYALPREDAVTHHITSVRGLALGRAGSPEEVARTVVFLGSPAASHITGTNVAVHGGMSTHLM